ncbi:MAG TPA: hypothetical protein PKM65_09155 [Spirochaetota bacterium]|nr:hypothetical protein [Spirochaetota bacterium]
MIVNGFITLADITVAPPQSKRPVSAAPGDPPGRLLTVTPASVMKEKVRHS